MHVNPEYNEVVSSLPQIKIFGRSTFDAIWAEKEHENLFSELLHVLHGKVVVKTPGYTITGTRGDIIYTPAFTPHQDLFSTDTMFEAYLIQFDWPDEINMLRKYTPTQLYSIQKPDKRKISAEIHNLYQTLIQDSSLSREIGSSMLLTIILRLFQAADSIAGIKPPVNQQTSNHMLMQEAKNFIRNEYKRPITLGEIASALNISDYYLSHIFSRESGFTLSSYLTDVRMHHAAKLLTGTQATVTSIAQAVGFSDACYFRKVFKLHFSVSPREYRIRAMRKME